MYDSKMSSRIGPLARPLNATLRLNLARCTLVLRTKVPYGLSTVPRYLGVCTALVNTVRAT